MNNGTPPDSCASTTSAKSAHKRCIKLKPERFEAYSEIGGIYQRLGYLHKAIDQGFKDRQQLRDDQQLATLRGTPEFDALLKSQP